MASYADQVKNINTSGLSGYALAYAQALQNAINQGASSSQADTAAHQAATLATGGSGMTPSQVSSIASGGGSASYDVYKPTGQAVSEQQYKWLSDYQQQQNERAALEAALQRAQEQLQQQQQLIQNLSFQQPQLPQLQMPQIPTTPTQPQVVMPPGVEGEPTVEGISEVENPPATEAALPKGVSKSPSGFAYASTPAAALPSVDELVEKYLQVFGPTTDERYIRQYLSSPQFSRVLQGTTPLWMVADPQWSQFLRNLGLAINDRLSRAV